jgi:vacuolar-type H+-ATPase subunit H
VSHSSDFLERFRAGGTPGAPAPGAVPADRVAEQATELGPLLDLLADVAEQADDLRQRASELAAERRRHGRERAAAILASAREEAEAERVDAADRARQVADDESAREVSAARRQARDIEAVARERMDDYVQRVLSDVREALSGAGPRDPS